MGASAANSCPSASGSSGSVNQGCSAQATGLIRSSEHFSCRERAKGPVQHVLG